MKRSLIMILLLLALLIVGAGLAYADETEWEDVKGTPISAEFEKDSYSLLRQIMDGAFDEGEIEDEIEDEEESAGQTQVLSDALPLLAALPAEDLESFAEAYSLSAEVVTESYYQALVNALRANITLNPNENDEAQKVLKLLLSEDDEDAGKEAVTPEALAQALTSYQLPAGFGDYLQNRDAEDEGGNSDEDQGEDQDEDLDEDLDEDQDAEDDNDSDAKDDDDSDSKDNDQDDDASDIEDNDPDDEDENDSDVEEDDDKDTGDQAGTSVEDDDDKDDGDEDSGSHQSGPNSDGNQQDGEQDDDEDNDD